jgi:hypothetical protein
VPTTGTSIITITWDGTSKDSVYTPANLNSSAGVALDVATMKTIMVKLVDSKKFLVHYTNFVINIDASGTVTSTIS